MKVYKVRRRARQAAVLPRDGDGDGRIFDGTKREMPAPGLNLVARGAKAVKSAGRRKGEPFPTFEELHDRDPELAMRLLSSDRQTTQRFTDGKMGHRDRERLKLVLAGVGAVRREQVAQAMSADDPDPMVVRYLQAHRANVEYVIGDKDTVPLFRATMDDPLQSPTPDGMTSWTGKKGVAEQYAHGHKLYAVDIPTDNILAYDTYGVMSPGARSIQRGGPVSGDGPGEVLVVPSSKAIERLMANDPPFSRPGDKPDLPDPADPKGELAGQLIADGGFTIDTYDGTSPHDGYIVAVPGHSFIATKEAFDKDGPQMIRDYLRKMRDDDLTDDIMFGGWYDTEHNEVVLDRVQRFDDRDEAVQAGIERGEQAIWDAAKMEEIPTGGTGGRENADIVGADDQRQALVAEAKQQLRSARPLTTKAGATPTWGASRRYPDRDTVESGPAMLWTWEGVSVPVTEAAVDVTGTKGDLWFGSDDPDRLDADHLSALQLLDEVQASPMADRVLWSGHPVNRGFYDLAEGEEVDVPLLATSPSIDVAAAYAEPPARRGDDVVRGLAQVSPDEFDMMSDAINKGQVHVPTTPAPRSIVQFDSAKALPVRTGEALTSGRFKVTKVEDIDDPDGAWWWDGEQFQQSKARITHLGFVGDLDVNDPRPKSLLVGRKPKRTDLTPAEVDAEVPDVDGWERSPTVPDDWRDRPGMDGVDPESMPKWWQKEFKRLYPEGQTRTTYRRRSVNGQDVEVSFVDAGDQNADDIAAFTSEVAALSDRYPVPDGDTPDRPIVVATTGFVSGESSVLAVTTAKDRQIHVNRLVVSSDRQETNPPWTAKASALVDDQSWTLAHEWGHLLDLGGDGAKRAKRRKPVAAYVRRSGGGIDGGENFAEMFADWVVGGPDGADHESVDFAHGEGWPPPLGPDGLAAVGVPVEPAVPGDAGAAVPAGGGGAV
jgi:hypothetical protein